MPTVLPRPRVQRARSKRSIASVLFNGFLVVSALALTFVVLMREEEYAFARPEPARVKLEQPDTADLPLPPD